MEKELVNQELEEINGGRSLTESFIREVYKEMKIMSDLFSNKKTNKGKNDPINAYDMIEYNKRNA